MHGRYTRGNQWVLICGVNAPHPLPSFQPLFSLLPYLCNAASARPRMYAPPRTRDTRANFAYTRPDGRIQLRLSLYPLSPSPVARPHPPGSEAAPHPSASLPLREGAWTASFGWVRAREARRIMAGFGVGRGSRTRSKVRRVSGETFFEWMKQTSLVQIFGKREKRFSIEFDFGRNSIRYLSIRIKMKMKK